MLLLEWPSQSWKHLQLNVCGELHGVLHLQHFLVMVYDLDSKWSAVTTVGSVTAMLLIDIFKALYAQLGPPKRVMTYNGPQTVSHETSIYLGEKGIRHIRTALYNLAANGGND